MKHNFLVDEPVFKTKTRIFVGYSLKEMVSELKKTGLSDSECQELHEFFDGANGGVLNNLQLEESFTRCVWIRGKEENPALFGTLAHEICHLVQMICKDKGVTDDETSAYLTDFYMRLTISKIMKQDPSWEK